MIIIQQWNSNCCNHFEYTLKCIFFFFFSRFDIGRPTRRFVLQSFTLQTGTVSIVIYFVALILSLCMANLEDKMNLYNRYPNLWIDENVRKSALLYIICNVDVYFTVDIFPPTCTFNDTVSSIMWFKSWQFTPV